MFQKNSLEKEKNTCIYFLKTNSTSFHCICTAQSADDGFSNCELKMGRHICIALKQLKLIIYGLKISFLES